ncbi:MAG: DUF4349 domain-containing protein [Bacteroidetes bacterium]|nr:DUF4349 domain-containing protein [Bacteroidota bacterium]
MKTALLPLAFFSLFIFSCGEGDHSPNRNVSGVNVKLDSSSKTNRFVPYKNNVFQTQNGKDRSTMYTDQTEISNKPSDQQQNIINSGIADENNFKAYFTTSAARVNKLDSTHRFIRTADIKFRAKDVANATYDVEDITTHFGGYVADTKLQSEMTSNTIIPVSADSSLQTIHYVVSNQVTLRVPYRKLDSLLRSLVPLVDYLDYRNVNTNDITLDLLANDLAQKRISNYNARLASDIDNKGSKLPDVQSAEDALLQQQENSDNSLVENLRMQDRIDYSTVTLNIYQPETVRQDLIKREKTVDAYEPSFGNRIGESFGGGWKGLQVFITAIVILWPVWIFGAAFFFGLKYLLNRKRSAK